jgi:hypothetical protein
MASSAETDGMIRPRWRSPEEMEETYRQIRARGSEGARLVEVHRQIIAKLDAMLEERRRNGRRRRS